MYKKFINWLHTEHAGDAQVIWGIEMILLFIALLWKFYDSTWSDIFKVENHCLFICINIGFIVLLITGLALLIYGCFIKFKNRK
jgi:hypothetical protein